MTHHRTRPRARKLPLTFCTGSLGVNGIFVETILRGSGLGTGCLARQDGCNSDEQYWEGGEATVMFAWYLLFSHGDGVNQILSRHLGFTHCHLQDLRWKFF